MRDVSCLLSRQKLHDITKANTTHHFGLMQPSKRKKKLKKFKKEKKTHNGR